MPTTPPSSSRGNDGARRRDPRLPVELKASISGRPPRAVTVVDLSLRGCLVRCEKALDQGVILDLSLDLEGTPLAVKVRVAESSLDGDSLAGEKRHLTGLQFLSLPAADELRLRSFLESERRRRSAHAPPA
jgi:hypothetical protein